MREVSTNIRNEESQLLIMLVFETQVDGEATKCTIDIFTEDENNNEREITTCDLLADDTLYSKKEVIESIGSLGFEPHHVKALVDFINANLPNHLPEKQAPTF